MIFKDWLNKQEARCILVELDIMVGGITSTLYLSNIGYTSASTDTPSNTAYVIRKTLGGAILRGFFVD